MEKNFTLIGIDGGASKVSAWLLEYNTTDDTFALTDDHAELSYSAIKGHIPDFKPVAIDIQLNEFHNNTTKPTETEIQQGETYVEACARVVISLLQKSGDIPLLIGLGMPGLKTEDKRGIAVVANGPRIVKYATELENKLLKAGIELLAPLAHIGSDADYCGIGEKYARDGSFRNVANAYYLGGGTGAADALLLGGNLIPFDATKSWLAKTWEMKNNQGLSLERYASASGLQHIYSLKSGLSVHQLSEEKIYPPIIANRALEGDKAALDTFADVADNLAALFYERIESLYCGAQMRFEFVNPNRPHLESTHPYLKYKFDHISVGQRLGDLLSSRSGNQIMTQPMVKRLAELIDKSEFLPEDAKEHYLHGNELKNERLVFSPLREAPALGAGIDAFLVLRDKISK
jgi:predicted NBD/HSP70 family sugar kinase